MVLELEKNVPGMGQTKKSKSPKIILAAAIILFLALSFGFIADAFRNADGGKESFNGSPRAGALATLTVNGVKFAFRYCPPLKNQKSVRWGKERDRLNGFWLMETELTRAQTKAALGEATGQTDSDASITPADNLSYEDCEKIVQRLNEASESIPEGWRFAIPSGTQWGCACRAGRDDVSVGAFGVSRAPEPKNGAERDKANGASFAVSRNTRASTRRREPSRVATPNEEFDSRSSRPDFRKSRAIAKFPRSTPKRPTRGSDAF